MLHVVSTITYSVLHESVYEIVKRIETCIEKKQCYERIMFTIDNMISLSNHIQTK